MSQYSDHIKTVLDRWKSLPMPDGYRALVRKYIITTYRWVPKINRALNMRKDTAFNTKFTPKSYALLKEHNYHVEQACELRDCMTAALSMLILVGFNYCTKDAEDKFAKVLEMLENGLIDHFVMIQRYQKAIMTHKVVRKYPKVSNLTVQDVTQSACWPAEEINFAFHRDGLSRLDLCE